MNITKYFSQKPTCEVDGLVSKQAIITQCGNLNQTEGLEGLAEPPPSLGEEKGHN